VSALYSLGFRSRVGGTRVRDREAAALRGGGASTVYAAANNIPQASWATQLSCSVEYGGRMFWNLWVEDCAVTECAACAVRRESKIVWDVHAKPSLYPKAGINFVIDRFWRLKCVHLVNYFGF
jgi:hypothetical protein